MASIEIQNTIAQQNPKALAKDVGGNAFAVAIPAESQKIRDAVVKRRQAFKVCNDDAQLAKITDVIRDAKALLKEVELTRKSLAAPFEAIVKKLRATEVTFSDPLKKVVEDLTGMGRNYEQRKLRQEEEEAAALKAKAAQVQETVAKLIESGDELAAERAAFAAPTESQLARKPTKVIGFSAKEVICFEVVDPIAFCQAHDKLWSWNKETENLHVMRREITELLNDRMIKPNPFWDSPFPEDLPATKDARALPNVPGLKLWWGMKSRIS